MSQKGLRGSMALAVVVGLVLFAIPASFDVAAAPPQTPNPAGDPPADHTPAGSTTAGKAIAAGEFAVAKSMPPQSIPLPKDAWLAQVASAQSRAGDTSGAAATIRQINSPASRQSVIDQTRGLAQGQPAAGGGAFADFDSLMNLIETTIVPDTWEALGGNSTMAPYPQGVFVDAAGTVTMAVGRNLDESIADGAAGNLNALLASDVTPEARDWRAPSNLRCISLRRLRDEIATRRMTGVPLGDALLNLAGLSQVQYLILADDDIILAAPVGGIDSDRGWYIDRESGRSTLRSDFLARCLASTFDNTPFGCTIDPTPAGMQSAMQVASEIRSGALPIGQSADKLKSALGMQRVEVFGAAGDTSVALLMVEADRHMKQLALGEQPMPEGVDNYLDAVDDFITQGPPDGLLLRLWFTANPQTVRSDGDKRVFEISGNAIRLSGENQRALADGGRGNRTVDPRGAQFVSGFNDNWSRIRDQYPIYGSLESLYRVAAVSHLIKQFGNTSIHHAIAQGLLSEDDTRDWNLAAPRQVESIATLHTVRKGGKRHHVLLASGGVSVATDSTVQAKIDTYPTLAGQIAVSDQRPATVNHWWWDAK